ncbi:MAG: nucleotide exchange factor GrpE, partial [Rhodospirillaceae bacterium]|nr:nucleotide exchange factor GrpE [Rhodospirillaceae bacterium]
MSDQNPADFMTPTPGPAPDGAPDPAPPGMPDAAERIIALAAEIEQLKKDKLMALADAENASKRADRRIAENAKFATANMCKALLQVADNLGRALLAAPADQRAANEAVKNLAMGVELTEKELMKVFEDQGVRRIAALNHPFDPNLHNAVQEVENTAVPSGTVVQVLVEGYTQHDRLLRPAMVVVARGGQKREAAPPQSAGSGAGVDT